MYNIVMKFLVLLIIFFFNLSSFSSLSASETVCGKSKNITYYSETDEYYSLIGPEKYLSDLENVLNNFGLITDNFEGNSKFEFIFLDNGNLIATDFETCEVEKLKWKYQYSPNEGTFKILAGFNNTNEYLLKFGLEGSNFYSDSYYYKLVYYQQGQQDCHNEMNPICHKFIAELDILGYSDLKNDLSYNEQRKIIIEEIEARKKAEEEERQRLLAEKKAKEEQEERERLAREKAEKERAEKEKIQREKAAKAKEEFDNSAYGMLFNSYTTYMMIRDLYEARKDYAIQYITSVKIADVRTMMKEIENKITSENKDISEDEVWQNASLQYANEYGSMDLIKSTGAYSDQVSALAKLQLLSFEGLYKDIIGAKTMEKDF